MLLFVISLLSAQSALAAIDSPNVAFKWKQVDFDYPTTQDRWDATNSKQFIPENNIPLGLEVYGDRIFITVPRWKEGVAASLVYINKTDRQDSPILHPYPNWEAHNQNVPDPQIVSPFRMRADNCGRLWVMDTGKTNILNSSSPVVKPKLLIFNLNTDKLIRSYTIPDDQLHEDNFFANIAVEESDDCDNNFAYLADLGQPALVVYDFKNNKSWMFKHHYFNIDPLAGNMKLAGLSFQWKDGIFGLSLSDKDAEGYSTLYFHPMTSFNEFNVSTKVLKNETLSKNPQEAKDFFKLLGTRGQRSQSGASFLHKKTGVLFYSLVQLNAVLCWRTSLSNYTMESQGRVFMNDEVMVFPNDIKVDANDILWVLTDKLPIFLYDYPNFREYNFHIINATVKEAIKGTPCDTKIHVDMNIMKNITGAGGVMVRSEVYLLSLIFLVIAAAV
ncbi:unnamed protein product [Psylliodes chrysocephalus]|uniref:Protein yellow n=1 Tax=Psylliodes chrysocephalus TaxID=3402493 RepID=A0A9P0G5F6_9CUCU|nr:unnamed protein product [Psylliodes chrysocephala]